MRVAREGGFLGSFAHLVNLTMLLPMVEMGAEAGPVTLLKISKLLR